MKNIVGVVLCAAATFALAFPALAGKAPGTGIKETYHDLSSKGAAATWGGGTWVNYGITYDEQATLDRICIYCHAPHHTLKPADNPDMYLPLWNHATSAVTTYTPYSAGTNLPDETINHASTTTDLQAQPGAVSKLCLSCHDGSVATNSYGFAPSQSLGKGTSKIAPNTRAGIGIGGDLTNHHPIGFPYNAVEAIDDEIALSTTTMSDSGKSIADLLYGGNMECVTCHDVHNSQNSGEKFLWVTDKQSGLCLTCHLKGDVKK